MTRDNHYFVKVTRGNRYFVKVTRGNHYFVRGDQRKSVLCEGDHAEVITTVCEMTRGNNDCVMGRLKKWEVIMIKNFYVFFWGGGGVNNCK